MIDRISTHLRALVGERHPLTSPAALLRTESYLTEEFRGNGWEVATHAFEALGGTYRNVVATLPPPVPHLTSSPVPRASGPPLIIGAHYDAVAGSPGADDNASGLAVLLEVARRLAEVSPSGPVHLIAFCLEEQNLLGSLAYAERLQARGEEIQGALILECVGYTCSKPGSQRLPAGLPIETPPVGDFLGVVGNQDSAGLLASFEKAANREVPSLKTVSLAVPGQGEAFPDTRRSDHAAFWHYGFPALMLTDTADYRNPHYHQPTDTLDTLDLEFMARVAEAVTAAVRVLSRSH